MFPATTQLPNFHITKSWIKLLVLRSNQCIRDPCIETAYTQLLTAIKFVTSLTFKFESPVYITKRTDERGKLGRKKKRHASKIARKAQSSNINIRRYLENAITNWIQKVKE